MSKCPEVACKYWDQCVQKAASAYDLKIAHGRFPEISGYSNHVKNAAGEDEQEYRHSHAYD
ncbi:unknown [Coprococcus eutactus CAG:665]|nr:unknown [Coprococcus eutactus CAG:665]